MIDWKRFEKFERNLTDFKLTGKKTATISYEQSIFLREIILELRASLDAAREALQAIRLTEKNYMVMFREGTDYRRLMVLDIVPSDNGINLLVEKP